MLEGDYLYVLVETAFPISEVDMVIQDLSPNSAYHKLIDGALIISKIDCFHWQQEADPFLQQWKMNNETTVQTLNHAVPSYAEQSPDFFQTQQPADFTSYVYDAVVSVGLGACWAETNEMEQKQSPPASGSPKGPPGGSVPNGGKESSNGGSEKPDSSAGGGGFSRYYARSWICSWWTIWCWAAKRW